MHGLKQKIHLALETNDLDAVTALARENRRVLSLLVRLAYDKDTLVGWRAIKAVGLGAKALVKTEYEYLRETARKLLWSLTDESGGIGWAAPELLGEIVSADPEAFKDIIPLIAQAYDVEEDVFRPGVLYAFSRIAEYAPEKICLYQKIIITSLMDKNPLVQIYSLGLVERLWKYKDLKQIWTEEYRNRVISVVHGLSSNKKVAWIYENNVFIEVEVGELSGIVAKIIK